MIGAYLYSSLVEGKWQSRDQNIVHLKSELCSEILTHVDCLNYRYCDVGINAIEISGMWQSRTIPLTTEHLQGSYSQRSANVIHTHRSRLQNSPTVQLSRPEPSSGTPMPTLGLPGIR